MIIKSKWLFIFLVILSAKIFASNDNTKNCLEAVTPLKPLQEIILEYCHNSWILSKQILKVGFSKNSINNLANCAVFTPCVSFIAIGYNDGSINIYDILFDDHKYILDSSNGGHNSAVLALAFEPKGKYLFSGSKDGSIKILDMNEGNCIRTLNNKDEGHKKDVDVFAVSPNGNWLCSGSKDGCVKIWDIKEISNIKCVENISCKLPLTFNKVCYPKSMAFSSDGKYFAFSILYNCKAVNVSRYPYLGESRLCKIDENEKKITTISKEQIIAYDLGFFNDNNKQYLCWLDNRNLSISSIDNIKHGGGQEDSVSNKTEYGKIIDVSDTAKLIAYVKSNDTIKIRFYISRHEFEIYHDNINSLAISKNGCYLIVLTKEGVKLWKNQPFAIISNN